MDLGKLGRLSEHRVCKECGEEFRTSVTKTETVTAMQQFADHLASHQPSAVQWANAYHLIRESNRGKKE